MDVININEYLNRTNKAEQFKQILIDFDKNKSLSTTKRGIYIYGDPGTGKTTFATNALVELGYDVIKYDAGDIRNKSIIDTITQHNMADKNIVSMFCNKVKKIAIIMDEIDGMNNGDKGGINALIKVIRPKKTKKQKLEEMTSIPIICIGNYHIDKKLKELMKVCHVIELNTPTNVQMATLVNKLMPELEIKQNVVDFVQGDLRKLKNICELYKNKLSILNNNVIQNIFLMKSYNDDTRKITKKLINHNYTIDEHLTIMNETDRTIVGLLWHENIVDMLSEKDIPFYLKLLNNMCFADYIDRITFQKQIWQFNEMSSLIKTFKNNKLYHERCTKQFNPAEVRFTKVLTKYSTEYNNSVFIQNMCQELGMDKHDMFAFFLDLKNKCDENEMIHMFEGCDISKLDIGRMYRYIDKYIKEDAVEIDEVIVDDDSVI